MFDYIRKEQYFAWIDRFADLPRFSTSQHTLKDVQDHYILSRLGGSKGIRMLEVGGGACRVLNVFAQNNECWNAEKFEGIGQGPKKVIEQVGVRNAKTYLGEFSPLLPDEFFDVVFSISVVEHVPERSLSDFFRDIARVLKPGGATYHAIDVYVFDEENLAHNFARDTEKRLRSYMLIPDITNHSLEFVQPAATTSCPRFRCDYASNPDREILSWNRTVPSLSKTRAITQSVSLMLELRKRLSTAPLP